jgi:3-hydroxyacyl-CoA dehydrogenase/enoyl-CoA hydratase/3-hydroxybutyryl-CoA epimerase/enoyl-CoA isomerase
MPSSGLPGAEKRPDAALKDGAVDAVVEPEKLKDGAIALVKQAIAGKLDWKAKREEKLVPVKLNNMEQMMAFKTATAMIVGKAGPNYPAPKLAPCKPCSAGQQHRDDALQGRSQALCERLPRPRRPMPLSVSSSPIRL